MHLGRDLKQLHLSKKLFLLPHLSYTYQAKKLCVCTTFKIRTTLWVIWGVCLGFFLFL